MENSEVGQDRAFKIFRGRDEVGCRKDGFCEFDWHGDGTCKRAGSLCVGSPPWQRRNRRRNLARRSPKSNRYLCRPSVGLERKRENIDPGVDKVLRNYNQPSECKLYFRQIKLPIPVHCMLSVQGGNCPLLVVDKYEFVLIHE